VGFVEDGIAWFEEQRLLYFATPATYVPVEGDFIEINVTVASPQTVGGEKPGVKELKHIQEFIVNENGLRAKPTPGDVIIFNGIKYEVANAEGMPCYERLTAQGASLLLIRTVRKAEQ